MTGVTKIVRCMRSQTADGQQLSNQTRSVQTPHQRVPLRPVERAESRASVHRPTAGHTSNGLQGR